MQTVEHNLPLMDQHRGSEGEMGKGTGSSHGRRRLGPGDSSGVAGSCGLTCRVGYTSASPVSVVACPDSFESFQGLTIVMTTAGEYLRGVLYRLSFNALGNPKWALVPSLQTRNI